VVFLVIRNSSNKRRIRTAALINLFVPNAALIRGRRLFGGGAYSSKYGMVYDRKCHDMVYDRKCALWYAIVEHGVKSKFSLLFVRYRKLS